MAENSLHDQIVQSLNKRFYGQPLIDNVYRGDYVETLILFALGKGWKGVGGWGSWDLEKGNGGVRIEVKQSAALQPPQPWYKPAGGGKSPSFSIAPKTGYYTDSTEDAVWVGVDPEEPDFIRAADIYIFAWHPETDRETADHRRAEQWQFFVVPEHLLTAQHGRQQTIGLNPLRKLMAAVAYDQLAATVAAAAAELTCWKADIARQDAADYYAAAEIMERIRQGNERVYSSAEVMAKLGLDR